VQMFQSLELAIEAAEALGPDHYIIGRTACRSGVRRENCSAMRNKPYPAVVAHASWKDEAVRLGGLVVALPAKLL
jgi:hypothetical protein